MVAMDGLLFRFMVYALSAYMVGAASTSNSIDTVIFVNKCSKTKTDYGIILKSHSQGGKFDFFNQSLTCAFTFSAKSPYTNIQLEFIRFDTGVRYIDTTAPCSTAYMNIYDGSSTAATVLKGPLCGTDRPGLTFTSGTSITIEVVLDGNSTVFDFKSVLTSYRSENAIGLCPGTFADFHCETSKLCIPTELTCLTPNTSSCGNQDYSDQSKVVPLSCPYDYVDLFPLWIALGILGAILPFVTYWCCWRPGYFEWICCCLRHKNCCDPCKSCSQGSRNCTRALFGGCRGCACCGPRNVSDGKVNDNGYQKMRSRKGVYVSNYVTTPQNGYPSYGYSNSSTPSPRSAQGASSADSGSPSGSTSDYYVRDGGGDGLHTRESR